MAIFNAASSWAPTDWRRLSMREAAEPFDEVSEDNEKSWIFTIYLNADLHFLDDLHRGKTRWQQMWGTLLHEMTHCYLRKMVNPLRRDFWWSEAEKGHGVHFQRVLRFINA